jgi:dTMP kinase
VPKKGLFVTLEGPDGSGKSTQRRLLAAALRKKGCKVVETREPGGSPLAEKIRALVLDPANHGFAHGTELLLFEAARCQHVEDTIRPALRQGSVVLCDRFTDSTMAYQGAGRALHKADVAWLNRFATAGLKPDLTLIYDLGAQQGLTRAKRLKGHADRMESADLAFHRRVRAAFKAIARAEPRRAKLIAVEGRSPQAVAEAGLALIQGRLA